MVQGLIENLKEMQLEKEDTRIAQEEIITPFITLPIYQSPQPTFLELMSNLTANNKEEQVEIIDIEKCAKSSAYEYLK